MARASAGAYDELFDATETPRAHWRDVLASGPQPAVAATFTVPYGVGGRPTNVRIEGVPTDGAFTAFRRCVVVQATERFSFEPLPEEPEVVVRTTLPGGP